MSEPTSGSRPVGGAGQGQAHDLAALARKLRQHLPLQAPDHDLLHRQVCTCHVQGQASYALERLQEPAAGLLGALHRWGFVRMERRAKADLVRIGPVCKAGACRLHICILQAPAAGQSRSSVSSCPGGGLPG